MSRTGWLGVLLMLGWVGAACAQQISVTGRVELAMKATHGQAADASNVVVWLTTLEGSAAASDAPAEPAQQHLRLLQKNKSFHPHVLVARQGAVVEFPNTDPFFHNVFSLFEGKRFDLGLYEAGSTRTVRFDRPGVSYIFCNIHPEMSAVVIVLKTPYYGFSDRTGHVVIPNVPPGNYLLQVWDEGALPEELKNLSREITVSENARSLGTIRVTRNNNLHLAHKNKYGRDYEPPTPSSPAYRQP